jgi:prolyl-tRNA editing enzyme YbaK/EbsC (Cys-tRNA(Pro) deacylase)
LETRAWPEPVERVAAFLRETATEARIEEFPEGTPTAQDAANAVGCKLAEIVKTIVFDCEGRFVLALVPGDCRADARKIAAAAGASRARVAGADDVEAATGFPPGAVAPFPTRRVDAAFIERTLLTRPRVWIGAGSDRHMAGLAPTDLVRLSRARAIDAVETRT